VLRETEEMEAVVDAALAGNDSAVEAALERNPGVARGSIYAAAALADAESAFAVLRKDPSLADQPTGRRAWTPLLYVCSSRFHRGRHEDEIPELSANLRSPDGQRDTIPGARHDSLVDLRRDASASIM